MNGMNLGQISHESKIDWLELSETGKKMLFRDKKLKLHIYDVDTQAKETILNYCAFVQVPRAAGRPAGTSMISFGETESPMAGPE